jgi:hypothetical protein
MNLSSIVYFLFLGIMIHHESLQCIIYLYYFDYFPSTVVNHGVIYNCNWLKTIYLQISGPTPKWMQNEEDCLELESSYSEFKMKNEAECKLKCYLDEKCLVVEIRPDHFICKLSNKWRFKKVKLCNHWGKIFLKGNYERSSLLLHDFDNRKFCFGGSRINVTFKNLSSLSIESFRIWTCLPITCLIKLSIFKRL